MGQEISSLAFTDEDERLFKQKLRQETRILKGWFDNHQFDDSPPKCGFELEAWLVTKDFVPAPRSDIFLRDLNDPLVVPEISKFNFELNSVPFDLKKKVFTELEEVMLPLWRKCESQAESMGLKALTIGTLPTLRDHMLTMDNLSPQKRYSAMNNRIMEMRGGAPIKIDIEGKDRIQIEHGDVITECAATSLQVHFGVTQDNGPRYYNASIVASAFMAAAAANSPYFYGKELWDECRIAIFEQSVNLKSFHLLHGKDATRVSLGNGYVRDSLMELFLENLDGHPILLPDHSDADPEWLEHLRLQNGTIWRWNRPLVGLTTDTRPGLRLEFRVPSSGPTIRDAVANMAFQIALVRYFFDVEELEKKIPFETARDNFYKACRHGLDTSITWLDGRELNIQEVILNEILPHLPLALESFGVDHAETEKYILNVIKPRIQSGHNGANWQKAFVHTHGSRFQEMLEEYYMFQKQNIPVHLWSV